MATWDDIGKLIGWFEAHTGAIADPNERRALERQFFDVCSCLTLEQLRRGCEHFTHVGWKARPAPLAFRELCESEKRPATVEQVSRHVTRIREQLGELQPLESRTRKSA